MMNKPSKIQYFEQEGRENLSDVVKSIKSYLKSLASHERPSWVIFLTSRGEGPLMAYHELIEFNVKIAAITFSATYSVKLADGETYSPEIPERVAKFFKGVEIPVVTARLPFDYINGAGSHNRDMELLTKTLSLFGGGVPLAIQGALQACDVGLIKNGERVIAASGDCALLVTASGTRNFLDKKGGLLVNEIISKPRSRQIPERTEAIPQILPKQA